MPRYRRRFVCRCARAASLVLALVAAAGSVEPAEPHGKDLIDTVWERYRSVGTEREAVEVLVVPEPRLALYGKSDALAMIDHGGGSIHKRAVRFVRYAADRQDRAVVRFSLPPADAGMGLLVWRNPDFLQDVVWLYMPGRQGPRRIPASGQASFVGTDFLYEDLREFCGERTARYLYSAVGAETLGDRHCEIVGARPVEGTSSAYTERKIWIDVERRFPLQVEYYDARGKWKVLNNSEIAEIEPGVFRADMAEMRDLLRQQATLLLVTRRQVRVDIAGDVFTTEHLSTGGED